MNEIFKIFFRPYNDNMCVTEILIPKYNKLREIYCRMTQTLPDQRPDCEEYSKKKISGV